MSDKAVQYLREHKGRFSRVQLEQKLLSCGYEQADVAESCAIVYGEGQAQTKTQTPFKFWDFKTERVYTKSSEKWQDFLFGFFATPLAGIFSVLIPLIGPIIFLGFCIYVMVLFYKKRKYIFYGMLTELLILPAIIFAGSVVFVLNLS